MFYHYLDAKKLHDINVNKKLAFVRLKLTNKNLADDPSIADKEKFDSKLNERRQDADEFYSRLNPELNTGSGLSEELQNIMRQALAGMKIDRKHLHIKDILLMPDNWQCPFFDAWDTAFHCIPLAMVDPTFAKNQVFKIEQKMYGREDLQFLERVFQKLSLNSLWWVNQKDASGQNAFDGGFLVHDNFGLLNQSEPLLTGGSLGQADGTAWMAFFALNMFNMALELAKNNQANEDIASKFFEHFLFISEAMTFGTPHNEQSSLWNSKDGFYYSPKSW
ncbi:hypothetical protein BY996DRAFT_6415783 [Phakopsora pachyrhizi]|nr:hypothetical protein BY996DRAFT_6415783 [Phakopsora pachyrhizi]